MPRISAASSGAQTLTAETSSDLTRRSSNGAKEVVVKCQTDLNRYMDHLDRIEGQYRGTVRPSTLS
jgi:hypothetical protein